MADPSVSVILLNYNGEELLRQYLPAVLDLDYSNFEVVVVDNDSDDGSIEFLSEHHPSVEVIENGANLGFSRGYNRGVEHTDTDYVWLLNTDVRVTPGSLRTLVEYIESSPETGIVGPRVHYENEPDRIHSNGYMYALSSRAKPVDADAMAPSKSVPHEVSYVTGAALLIDRDVWEEVGGFDDANFMYGDDAYLCLRSWLCGYRVESIPDSIVYHEEGRTREKVPSPKIAYHQARGPLRTHLKLLQGPSLIRGLPGLLLVVLYQLSTDIVRSRSPIVALYRALGYLSVLGELGNILQDRRQIQQDRVYDDGRFLP